jgi:hypothetical protein
MHEEQEKKMNAEDTKCVAGWVDLIDHEKLQASALGSEFHSPERYVLVCLEGDVQFKHVRLKD